MIIYPLHAISLNSQKNYLHTSISPSGNADQFFYIARSMDKCDR